MINQKILFFVIIVLYDALVYSQMVVPYQTKVILIGFKLVEANKGMFRLQKFQDEKRRFGSAILLEQLPEPIESNLNQNQFMCKITCQFLNRFCAWLNENYKSKNKRLSSEEFQANFQLYGTLSTEFIVNVKYRGRNKFAPQKNFKF